MSKETQVSHPVQVDVGVLWGGQAQRVDLHKAEGRQLARFGAAAQLPHHLVHCRRLPCARNARHVQALSQALLACKPVLNRSYTVLSARSWLPDKSTLSRRPLARLPHIKTAQGNPCLRASVPSLIFSDAASISFTADDVFGIVGHPHCEGTSRQRTPGTPAMYCSTINRPNGLSHHHCMSYAQDLPAATASSTKRAISARSASRQGMAPGADVSASAARAVSSGVRPPRMRAAAGMPAAPSPSVSFLLPAAQSSPPCTGNSLERLKGPHLLIAQSSRH